jgi:hypothetical protein
MVVVRSDTRRTKDGQCIPIKRLKESLNLIGKKMMMGVVMVGMIKNRKVLIESMWGILIRVVGWGGKTHVAWQ